MMNDRPYSEGITGSGSVAEASRKRPFKILAQDVSSSSARGNDSIMGGLGLLNRDQNIPEGLESIVRRMVSTAQDMQNRMDTIQNENKELKDKCNELEIKVKDLTLKNEYNEWSYAAEGIPASYWIERGFSEEYAQQMRSFLSRLVEYAHQLRRGASPIEKIMLTFVNDHMLHDDILLPHWKEFADALMQYQKFNHREDYGIEVFQIEHVQLQQEVIDMLAPALETSQINTIRLGRNIGSDILLFTEEIIQNNPHLKQVGWRDQIQSVDDMRRLCNSIEDSVALANSSLNAIGLYNTYDGDNSEMMRIVLDASLQLDTLGLISNGIGSIGAQLIANWLSSNPPLRTLNLTGNNLNDTGTTILANALLCNANLKQLDLANNNITEVGRRVLLESVFNVSSLDACVASNHRCRIHGLNPDISKINRYAHPSDNRAMKIFTILSATDEGFFNMNCLGDVSYQLIPRVLRLAQKFRGRTPELSDMYFEQTGQKSADWSQLNDITVQITSLFELLRGWAVPSLSV